MKNEMSHDIQEVLFSQEEVSKKVHEIGEDISRDYKNKKPILVGLLKGSVPFMAELLKNLTIYVETDYMVVSSYHGVMSSGQVKVVKDLEIPIEGRHVLIVEDIIDTGRTIDTIQKLFMHRGAASVEFVCLLDKPLGREIPCSVKYIGFEVGNQFVVGYGLDFNQFYRNLPFIGVLKEEVYKKGGSY